MPENDHHNEPLSRNRPDYKEDDLPTMDEHEGDVVPILPERQIPSGRPVYEDRDLPKWGHDE